MPLFQNPAHSSTRKRKADYQEEYFTKRYKTLNISYRQVSSNNFWDSLSKVWLTKSALRELDRRNTALHNRNLREETQQNRTRIRVSEKALQQLSSTSLKELKSFARRGGANLSDLRACSALYKLDKPAMDTGSQGASRQIQNGGPSATTSEQTTSKPAKNSRSKDGNFQQTLIDGGIFDDGYCYPDGREVVPPSGLAELERRLRLDRASLPPSRFSDADLAEIRKGIKAARNEDAVKTTVLSDFLKLSRARDDLEPNVLFTNIQPMVGGISRAQPDYYAGAQPEAIDQQIRSKLDKYIIPSSNTRLPAVPNFFMEVKSQHGTIAGGVAQLCHDGAVGARAMHKLINYASGTEESYDGQIRTLSVLYHGRTLSIYGHWVVQPDGPASRPEYHMQEIATYVLTNSLESLVESAVALKNARVLAAEYRNEAIATANSRARQAEAGTCTNNGAGLSSPVTTTELEDVEALDSAERD